MSARQRILVLTSCTSRKASGGTGDPVVAEALYTGQQHVRLMRGIHAYRGGGAFASNLPELDLFIVSAGFGVVSGADALPPYDRTFSSMSRVDARAWAKRLGVPSAVARLLSRPYALALLLLGERYLDAASFLAGIEFGGPTFALCGKGGSARLPRHPQLAPVVLDEAVARSFRCGYVGLKGEVAGRLLRAIASGGSLPRSAAEILDHRAGVG